jgi:phage host-nuclease inhibitor protein Gam
MATLQGKKADTKRIKQEAAIRTPQSKAELEADIARIGELERERARIQADLNDQVSKLVQASEEKAGPMAEQIATLFAGVQTYCEAHRDELTENRKAKTVNLSSGKVEWRLDPHSVVAPKSGKKFDALIEALKAAKLDRFIRTEEVLDKVTILAERDTLPAIVKEHSIKNLAVQQLEQFAVIPAEVALTEVKV